MHLTVIHGLKAKPYLYRQLAGNRWVIRACKRRVNIPCKSTTTLHQGRWLDASFSKHVAAMDEEGRETLHRAFIENQGRIGVEDSSGGCRQAGSHHYDDNSASLQGAADEGHTTGQKVGGFRESMSQMPIYVPSPLGKSL